MSSSIRGDPARVPTADLRRAVGRLAAAALLARAWREGARQDAALALAGGLCRAGWEEAAIGQFIQAVTLAAQDAEAAQRIQSIGFGGRVRRPLACRQIAQLCHRLFIPTTTERPAGTTNAFVGHPPQILGAFRCEACARKLVAQTGEGRM